MASIASLCLSGLLLDSNSPTSDFEERMKEIKEDVSVLPQ